MPDCEKLLEKYSTPFYVFDFEKAVARTKKIQSILPKNAVFCYAIKANAFLLRALKDVPQILFEACSEGELEICKSLRVAPEKIVFSGVFKSRAMIKNALDYGVKTVTLESLSHLEDLLFVLPKEKTQEVLVRLSSGNQFGMSADDVKKAVKIVAKNPALVFRGIHFFSGTQKRLKKIQEEIAFIENFCRELKNECEVDFSSIEYGPGLSFDYFCKEDFSENFFDLESLSSCIKNSAFNYVVELGRFLAAPCGKYFSKICDKKSFEKTNFLILDGGINHVNYYGQIMAMKVPPAELLPKSFANAQNSTAQKYCVCGSLCTTADVLVKELLLFAPKIGDILVFKNIGAYSVTEGLYLFLSHDFPLVLSQEGKKIQVLRSARNSYDLNF